jgi:hypothetical protein
MRLDGTGDWALLFGTPVRECLSYHLCQSRFAFPCFLLVAGTNFTYQPRIIDSGGFHSNGGVNSSTSLPPLPVCPTSKPCRPKMIGCLFPPEIVVLLPEWAMSGMRRMIASGNSSLGGRLVGWSDPTAFHRDQLSRGRSGKTCMLVAGRNRYSRTYCR